MTQRAYVVVPFERSGIKLGPSHAFVFAGVSEARKVAQQLAPRVAGVAILERHIDPETGDDRDTLIAGIGAVPPGCPTATDWSLKLH